MKGFREIDPEKIENVIKLIGSDWMLITAADKDKVNTMTASWGCMGVLWNKNICVAFVRPQRYTYEFVENSNTLSLSFFEEKYRDALRFCGSHSGREYDKFKETGLSYEFDEDTPVIEQAKLIIECRKLYADDLKKNNFVISEPLSHYKADDYHRFYICEIEKVLIRE
jgi:flavin reductase (DIM6/NTAB) family NADH-FMN oxidoreductase RutF